MVNRHNRLAQWATLRLWRMRCRWHARRMTPGARVRIVSPASTFRGMTGTIVETAAALPWWRTVELDKPARCGEQDVQHINVDTIGLALVGAAS